MNLIKIRHYYAIGDVWSIVGENWTEDQCREYVAEEESQVYVLDHGEYSRPIYYLLDEPFPEWTDGGWYDYDRCDNFGEIGSTCNEGCHVCPYIESHYRLQEEQQVEWIEKYGEAL